MMFNTDVRFRISANIVAREIAGDVVVIPITTVNGAFSDELYTLNATGKAIWHCLDGQTTLGAMVDSLATQFAAPRECIHRDVLGLLDELQRRGFIELT